MCPLQTTGETTAHTNQREDLPDSKPSGGKLLAHLETVFPVFPAGSWVTPRQLSRPHAESQSLHPEVSTLVFRKGLDCKHFGVCWPQISVARTQVF